MFPDQILVEDHQLGHKIDKKGTVVFWIGELLPVDGDGRGQLVRDELDDS